MKRKSLNHTLFISMFFLGVLGIFGSAYIWGALEYSKFKKEAKVLRSEYLDSQKDNIQRQVESALQFVNYRKKQTTEQLKACIKQRTYEAHAIATSIYNINKDKLSKSEIAKLIHDALYPASWNSGKGYYFAEDMQGTELINRNNPELEGTDISKLRDSKGVCIMQQIYNVVRTKGEGFCSYHWNKPGSPGVLLPKYSFVKYFKPLNWVIGNGKYLKDQEDEVKKSILTDFDNNKTDKGGYIFFGTYDGLSLSYPAKGKYVLEMTDVNGKKVVEELIKKAKSGGGFVSYVMPPLGAEQNKNKLSYVVGIDDWQWYMGYGVYTDEIEKVIAQKEAILHRSIREQTLNSILLLLILLLTALIFARSVAHKVSDDFNKFSILVDHKKDITSIPVDQINFKEFKSMAKSVNSMLEESNRHNEKNIQLQKQLDMAQKMEALGLMAGGVAHDLNNTLSAIINIPEYLLMEMEDDDPKRASLEMILDAGKRAAAIVKDMLTIGRGVVTRMDIEDLNALINESKASAEFQELKSLFPDVELELHLAENSLSINCYVPHIKKMIYNLVNNGMESIKGKGNVAISTSELRVDKAIFGFNEVPPGEYHLLEVSDSGIGIPEENLEKIFEPFYTKKELGRSGTGLGLAIVWNSVIDHHAFIQVDSDSSGTKFSIYFPVEDVLEKENRKNAAGNSKIVNEKESIEILVVDDEEIQRAVLGKMLKKQGYNIFSVVSGEEAVDLLKERKFDLIMLDMMLGAGINGRETYKQLLEINPSQKAVVVTGYAMNADVEETIKMGASGCLHKPYSLKELTEIVEQALSK